MRLTRQQRAAPDAHPESCWAVRCPPSHSPTSAAGSPQQAEIHPCPKDNPTSVGALCFFPPAGVRLARVCLLCYSSQNPGPNKAPSIGPVTLSTSATGWQWSLPCAPGSGMPGESFPLGCRSAGQGLHAFHSTGGQKNPPLRESS